MAKSLKARLDQAYSSLIAQGGCLICGIPEYAVCEIFFRCHDDPEDQEYVSDRKDAQRCPSCNKPDVIVLWDAVRPKSEKAEDQATPSESNGEAPNLDPVQDTPKDTDLGEKGKE